MLRGAFVIFTCIKEPASGKCFNARNFKENFGKPHFVLALCLYRLRKRKCGRPSEIICRNRVPVLAVHVLALNLQRKNQKVPHRKLSWEVRHTMRKWKWHRFGKLFTTAGVAGATTPLSYFGNINDVYHIRIEDGTYLWVAWQMYLLLTQIATNRRPTSFKGRTLIDVQSIRL